MKIQFLFSTLLMASALTAIISLYPVKEIHVALAGNNANSGAEKAPFRTIQRAADVAQAGDVITVHVGIYRESVNPPRGGTSESQRIVYQSAAGKKS